MHDDRDRKPRDEEIDVYGLTHRGRVRDSNQDHFLICLLRRQIDVLHTSLPEAAELGRNSDRGSFTSGPDESYDEWRIELLGMMWAET